MKGLTYETKPNPNARMNAIHYTMNGSRNNLSERRISLCKCKLWQIFRYFADILFSITFIYTNLFIPNDTHLEKSFYKLIWILMNFLTGNGGSFEEMPRPSAVARSKRRLTTTLSANAQSICVVGEHVSMTETMHKLQWLCLPMPGLFVLSVNM